jgi:hypothetical protein
MNAGHDTIKVMKWFSAFLFIAFLLFISGCTPCGSAYVIGCADFPSAAPRQ